MVFKLLSCVSKGYNFCQFLTIRKGQCSLINAILFTNLCSHCAAEFDFKYFGYIIVLITITDLTLKRIIINLNF